ncbi:MAG: hypothetical protein R6W88_13070 [Desulfobacterales bacterium]
MIPAEEKKKIAEWGRNLKDDIRITLILTEDERSQTFKDFCDELADIVPKIRVEKEKDEDTKPPVIRFVNVGYQAIPTGKELEPFLSALVNGNNHIQNVPLSVQKKLYQIRFYGIVFGRPKIRLKGTSFILWANPGTRGSFRNLKPF